MFFGCLRVRVGRSVTMDTFPQIIRANAHLLNVKNAINPSAKPFYEMMSGAYIWPDEIERAWPNELISELRAIFAYRSSLYRGEEREEFCAIWKEAKKVFPEWIGFSEPRVSPPPEILEQFRQDENRANQEIDALFADND